MLNLLRSMLRIPRGNSRSGIHPLARLCGPLSSPKSQQNHAKPRVNNSKRLETRRRTWYISPFLRALETAAYVLSPLKALAEQQGSKLQLRVTPQANEIVQTSMSCPAGRSIAEPLSRGSIAKGRRATWASRWSRPKSNFTSCTAWRVDDCQDV